MALLDKMLRIAGRGPDGKAKAIRTDESGNLLVKPTNKIVVKKEGELTLNAGAYGYISTGLVMDEDWYSLGMYVGGNVSANLRIEERWMSPDLTQVYRTTAISESPFSTRDVKGRFGVVAKHLTLHVTNNGTNPITIKYTVFGGVN